MDPTALMQRAIQVARSGIKAGQSPFGCAISLAGRVIACRHNTVAATPDITGHAEINALRTACLATRQMHLSGALVATTCEPCPMCMAALHWARVEVVYFGATIADATEAGFNELQLPAQRLLELGGSDVKLVGGVSRDECCELFRLWLQSDRRTCY